MSLHRLTRFAWFGVFAGLLALAHVQHTQALFGIVWRTSVLSWDDPATQLVEQLASQTAPHADTGRQGHAHLVAPRKQADLLPDRPSRARGLALSQGITRSPPTA